MRLFSSIPDKRGISRCFKNLGLKLYFPFASVFVSSMAKNSLTAPPGLAKTISHDRTTITPSTGTPVLFSVIIPFLKPAITISLILNTMTSIKAFDLIYALTRGGPGYATYVLQFYAYRVGFEHMEMGYGSAIAWIVSLLIFVFTVFYYRLVYREMAY